ncbi:hypothetical protein HDU91_005791 [Kappamyces sp. JEL0680]|nr:hypothetical protein HDU91_005791 [Kappamyces sp. JEL0680]
MEYSRSPSPHTAKMPTGMSPLSSACRSSSPAREEIAGQLSSEWEARPASVSPSSGLLELLIGGTGPSSVGSGLTSTSAKAATRSSFAASPSQQSLLDILQGIPKPPTVPEGSPISPKPAPAVPSSLADIFSRPNSSVITAPQTHSKDEEGSRQKASLMDILLGGKM